MSSFDRFDNWPASALQAADRAFAALTVDPAPLTLDCAALLAAAGTSAAGTSGTSAVGAAGASPAGPAGADGTDAAGPAGTTPCAPAGGAGIPPDAGTDLDVPAGAVPLPALRDWLMAHPTAYTVRDTVWRELIRRARDGEPEWVIAAVGMAMPALVAMAGQLAAGFRGESVDIDSEILTGFLEGLRRRVDPAKDAPHASLCGCAFRAGWDLRTAGREYEVVADIEYAEATSRLPRAPYGHVDLLVYRAQALGILDAEDVEPYIAVRLGHRTPQLVAEAHQINVDVLRMRLHRADARLAEALAGGVLTGVASPEARAALGKRQQQRAARRAGKAARHLASTAGTPPVAAAAA